MKRLSLVLIVCMVSILALAPPASADQVASDPLAANSHDMEGDDQVLFKGQFYCVGVEDCRQFAFWGKVTARSAGYVVLTEPDGFTPSDYIWVDINGFLWFESDDESGGFAVLPPAYLRKLGSLVEDGTLQEVDQFFSPNPGRTLFVQSSPVERAVSEASTPEPSTLLLVGPAAVLLFSRMRRSWRA